MNLPRVVCILACCCLATPGEAVENQASKRLEGGALADPPLTAAGIHAGFGDTELVLRPALIRMMFSAESPLPSGLGGEGSPDDLSEALAAATLQFVRAVLGAPFSATFSGQPESGEPVLAVVETWAGACLGEELVSAGLATVDPGADPAGIEQADFRLERLRGLEREAAMKKRGARARGHSLDAFRRLHLPAADIAGSADSIAATATPAILELLGKPATVRGTVFRIGQTASGHITFINFAGVPRDGFVAIVRREQFDAVAADLPGFPESLVGRTIEISGRVSEHRGTPQIEVRAASQIRDTQP